MDARTAIYNKRTGDRHLSGSIRIFSGALALSLVIAAQAPQEPPRRLAGLSESFQMLSRLVSPSVVKVNAVGYRQLEEGESDEPGVAARQHSAGSGVIIEAGGLIVTNAHVVVGAQRVQVTLPASGDSAPPRRSAVKPTGRIVHAEVVGIDLETDIAVLRIQEKNLAALKFADSEAVEQGEIVLAFGSPMGLDNSVTMGVVSSAARQLKPDDPMIYIQTDAPINPGNSGGPLVNAQGNVVGINTLILTQSGGSEGLGFAVPSNLVQNVVEQILKSGRVIRGEIGVTVQTVNTYLSGGLKLSQDWGILISDVEPDGPGDRAGLRVGDLIVALNGRPMENARQFNVNVYRPAIGETVQLDILRGKQRLSIAVSVVERQDDASFYADLASREENLIYEFGIFAVDLTAKLRDQVAPQRVQSGGVLVASKSADGPLIEETFRAGDIISRINRAPVAGVAELRALLRKMKPGDPVAVQIERQGRFRYIAFELP